MTLCIRKIIFALTALLVFWMIVPFAQAGNLRIAIMISNDSAPYRETLGGFQEYLRRQGLQSDFSIYNLNDNAMTAEKAVQEIRKNRAGLILTLGTLATEASLEKIRDMPVVAGLILKANKVNNTDNATGVILEFPLETQFKMIRRVLPEVKTVGVIYNPKENKEMIRAASKVARDMGLSLDAQEVNTPQDLPPALEKLANSADVLWGVADNLVLTAQTAKHILLFSYRNKIPFIGLSSTWVKSGALYSLDRDYADIGIQCGEMAIKILQGSTAGSIPPAVPRKVIYSVNLKTAQYMKLNIPEAVIKNAHQIY